MESIKICHFRTRHYLRFRLRQLLQDQKKTQMNKSKNKKLGIIHNKSVPARKTINQHFYQQVFNKTVFWKTLRTTGCCITSALSHSNFNKQVFNQKKNPVAPQASYSLDLSPCDIFLIQRLKIRLNNAQKHSNCCNQPSESYYSMRVPALLWGEEEASPALSDSSLKEFWGRRC